MTFQMAEVAGHLSEGSIDTTAFTSRSESARLQLLRLEPMLRANPYGYGELASALLLADRGVRVFGGVGASALVSLDRDFSFLDLIF